MTTTFSVTRDDVIKAALRAVGAIGKTESPDSEDYANCGFALNLIIKSWIATGMPLWKVVDIPIPLIVNQAKYNIGPNLIAPDIVSDKPLRVLDAFIRLDASKLDTDLMILSRTDYDLLSAKFTAPSVPNSIYYQPLTTYGVLTIYPPPSDTTRTIHLAAQVPLSDVLSGSDLLDFPSECYRALKWNLADEISDDYKCSDQKISRIAQKARLYKEEMENWSQEEASLYLSYETRSR